MPSRSDDSKPESAQSEPVDELTEAGRARIRAGLEEHRKKEVDRKKDEGHSRPRESRLVSFPFPLHISDVRAGYNKGGDAANLSLPSVVRS